MSGICIFMFYFPQRIFMSFMRNLKKICPIFCLKIKFSLIYQDKNKILAYLKNKISFPTDFVPGENSDKQTTSSAGPRATERSQWISSIFPLDFSAPNKIQGRLSRKFMLKTNAFPAVRIINEYWILWLKVKGRSNID